MARAGSWARCAAAAAFVAMIGALAAGQSPQPPKNAPEPRPVAPVGEDDVATERARLQGQLKELLKRLNERPPMPSGPRAGLPSTPRPKFEFGEGSRPGDGLRVAMNLFRDNDFDSALRAFRLIDTAGLPREDRAFVQYMTGCCLRRLGKRNEAAAQFREVADAKDDEFVADCAVWQLSLLRSTQELEATLEQVRSRPKAR